MMKYLNRLSAGFRALPRAAKYALFFCALVFVGALLLVFAALLPQQAIAQNIAESMPRLLEEGLHPTIHEDTLPSSLDNYTDAIILDEAHNMNAADISSVFRNPMHHLVADEQGEGSTILGLKETLVGTGKYSNYTRYWMGFRVTMRFLLCFFNLMQIRRLTSALLFILMAAVTVSIAVRRGALYGGAFALSMVLVDPEIICGSLQFSCCFFISLAAMLLAPFVSRRKALIPYYFIFLGALTMYFDFYTTPLLCFGLPMIYLLLLSDSDKKARQKSCLACGGLWLGSYLAMWLAKLSLTALFTGVNSFKEAFGQTAVRLGITMLPGLEYQYNPLTTPLYIGYSLGEDVLGCVVFGLFFSAIFAAWLVLLKKRGVTKADVLRILKENPDLLAVMLTPLVWFLVSSQPVHAHFWFQYRSIAVLFFALFGLMLLALEANMTLATENAGSDANVNSKCENN